MKFNITLQKLTETLRALGFVEIGSTESHLQFVHFDGRETVLPNCEEISDSVFRQVVLDICGEDGVFADF